ncbi:dihydroneopterin aldolase [Saprospira grandis DSM 2844]|uniref:7,8-dihydroneopterin aldolase n=1 Tax=Saprospira grandis DSM 2844 TaxID=694433 RepID=J0NXR1_9BACT|nr:dihydroneopterin aldolase [Saprospira grandis]EJF52294.1 dihydroneopterin aldolase [Saprospira grandis DSM 2844]
MGRIGIEGMEFYAYHGFYEEERKMGGRYRLDVYVETATGKVGKTDELGDTVNYETIYRAAKVEMAKPSKMIEHLAQRIMDRLRSILSKAADIELRLSKLDPPLGGPVSRTFVELQQNFVVKCGKCGKKFLQHEAGECWEKHGLIYPETKATLIRNHGPNICSTCIQPHLIKNKD